MIAWHYTAQCHHRARQVGIYHHGAIECSGGLVGERPAVWFTRSPKYDPTAVKGALTFDDMIASGVEAWRFGIDATGLVSWDDHRKTMDPDFAEAIVATAQGADPRDWLLSYEPVTRARWIHIDYWNGRRWVDGRTTLDCLIDMVRQKMAQVTASRSSSA